MMTNSHSTHRTVVQSLDAVGRSSWRKGRVAMRLSERTKRPLMAVLSLATVLVLVALALSSPSPAEGTTTKGISAENLDSSHNCDSTNWTFIINQIDVSANAPASIHVTWANGS